MLKDPAEVPRRVLFIFLPVSNCSEIVSSFVLAFIKGVQNMWNIYVDKHEIVREN